MVVLYWSWLRSVCSTSRPDGTGTHCIGFTAKFALPVTVGNSRGIPWRMRQLETVGWRTLLL